MVECTCLLHIVLLWRFNFITSICSGLVVQVVSALLRGNWQDFNWHNASRGHSAIAELLVALNSDIWWHQIYSFSWESIDHRACIFFYFFVHFAFTKVDMCTKKFVFVILLVRQPPPGLPELFLYIRSWACPTEQHGGRCSDLCLLGGLSVTAGVAWKMYAYTPRCQTPTFPLIYTALHMAFVL